MKRKEDYPMRDILNNAITLNRPRFKVIEIITVGEKSQYIAITRADGTPLIFDLEEIAEEYALHSKLEDYYIEKVL